MDKEPVKDDRISGRGLLTVPDAAWELAVERAAVIGPLAESGTLGHLLTTEPDRTVHDGAPPRGLWDGAHEAADECLARAQQDPLIAEKVLAALTSLTRSEHSFQRIRSDLIALDIPEEFLPRTLAIVRAI